MRISLCLATTLLVVAPLCAQDRGYWVANRASNDIMEVTPWGAVIQRVDMGTSLRSAHVAPDGKVWVVRFGQSTFDIYDPSTGTITPVASALGSPYDIAFDAQGDAWVSGGTGVQHFDANGAPVASYPLAQGAPLGITIDTAGNKWIAHRTSPGSVTRIDPAGVVTNYPVTGVLPVRPTADYRGLLNPSHIWVTCDTQSGGALLELDANGNELNNYTMPNASIGGIGPVVDVNGDVWVGSFGNGSLFQVDPATGAVLNTYSVPPSINGLSVDTFGRLLCTQRITFSGVGPPCEVERVDPATGVTEVLTLLEFGGFSSTGTQSALSTPWQYAYVVAPFADSDGDGEVNFSEITNGTGPFDASSNSAFSVATTGVTQNGSIATIRVTNAPSTIWLIGVAGGLLPAPTPAPGFGGTLLIDPAGLVAVLAGVGPSNLPLAIPGNPGLAGVEVFMQGVLYDGVGFDLRNLSGVRVW